VGEHVQPGRGGHAQHTRRGAARAASSIVSSSIGTSVSEPFDRKALLAEVGLVQEALSVSTAVSRASSLRFISDLSGFLWSPIRSPAEPPRSGGSRLLDLVAIVRNRSLAAWVRLGQVRRHVDPQQVGRERP